MTWWALSEHHGVLELKPTSAGIAPELHWILHIGRHTVAWWADELGRWLCDAAVGLC